MKYSIVNDFKHLFFKNKKYLSIYLVSIISIIGINFFLKYNMNQELFYRLSGLTFDLDKDVISTITSLVHFVFMIYICIDMFTKDIKFGKENIFLRIKANRWIIYKVISIILITIFLRIVIYSILIVASSLNFTLIRYLIVDIMYFILIQNIVVFTYVIYRKNKFVSLIILLCLIGIIFTLKTTPIFLIEHSIIIFVLMALVILANIKITKHTVIKIFENC